MAGRRLWKAGIVAVVVGAALLVVAVALGVSRVTGSIGVPMSTPTQLSATLGAGDHVIYEQVGGSGIGGTTSPTVVDLGAADVKVTGPRGDVAVGADSGNFSVSASGRAYVGVATFHADVDGSYTVQVAAADGVRVVALGPTLGSTANSLVVPLLIGVFGLGVLVAGVVVAIVNRPRAPAPPFGPTFGPPAGGWPTPTGWGAPAPPGAPPPPGGWARPGVAPPPPPGGWGPTGASPPPPPPDPGGPPGRAPFPGPDEGAGGTHGPASS